MPSKPDPGSGLTSRWRWSRSPDGDLRGKGSKKSCKLDASVGVYRFLGSTGQIKAFTGPHPAPAPQFGHLWPSILTCDFGFEGTPTDVIGSSIFHTDQVVPGSHGGVVHLVALWDLLALHFDFGRTLDGYR